MQQKKPAFYCGIETNYSFLSIKQITMDKIFLHIKSTRKHNRRVNDIVAARQLHTAQAVALFYSPFRRKRGGISMFRKFRPVVPLSQESQQFVQFLIAKLLQGGNIMDYGVPCTSRGSIDHSPLLLHGFPKSKLTPAIRRCFHRIKGNKINRYPQGFFQIIV